MSIAFNGNNFNDYNSKIFKDETDKVSSVARDFDFQHKPSFADMRYVKPEDFLVQEPVISKGGWGDIRKFDFNHNDIFKPQVKEKKAPEISGARVFFNRLTDEQIAQVNETKQLPKNAKVVDDVTIGQPRLTWNLFDITPGTHTLPAGYELKKGILGFTHLVREGTQAWYLKK